MSLELLREKGAGGEERRGRRGRGRGEKGRGGRKGEGSNEGMPQNLA